MQANTCVRTPQQTVHVVGLWIMGKILGVGMLRPEEVEKNITTAVWPNQARDLGGGNTIVIPCNKTVQLWQGIT